MIYSSVLVCWNEGISGTVLENASTCCASRTQTDSWTFKRFSYYRERALFFMIPKARRARSIIPVRLTTLDLQPFHLHWELETRRAHHFTRFYINNSIENSFATIWENCLLPVIKQKLIIFINGNYPKLTVTYGYEFWIYQQHTSLDSLKWEYDSYFI